MATPIVVPDASVLLKWILPSDNEPDADQAVRLRDAIVEEQVRALVPALWLYEVGNTIARRFPMVAEQWLSVMMRFGLEEARPSERWLTTTLHLTRAYGATFYDAAYHATALIHGGVLVTGDSRYLMLAKAEGALMSLSDWRAPTSTTKHRGR